MGKSRRFLKLAAGAFLVLVAAVLLYGAKGYFDALGDSKDLGARADRLIAQNRGARGLGAGRIDQLLKVEDPGFRRHQGVDVTTPGAGMTTITQSLAKRLAFDHFRPGIRKIRQTGYAIGLEQRLSKRQILALFLDTIPMGRGKKGWMTGFYVASLEIYGRPAADLDERQFFTLVAVMIAPRKFDLHRQDAALDERVSRIQRLVAGKCRPQGEGDVWLDGCA